MDHKDSLRSWCSDYVENFAYNIWKIAPFRAGNRMWLMVVIQAYAACLASCFLLACVLNSVEGEKWIANDLRGEGVTAKGNTAIDECFWFVFTTVHGIAMGEFNARGVASRLIAMACISIGYWFAIFLMCIVLLCNLPGERIPSFCGVAMRVLCAVWPSYLVFIFITVTVGSMMGPYVSDDPYGDNEWPTGIYWMWTVVHRMPYGDIWPETSFGRTMTVPAAILGMLYMPYAMALVAVRCPTLEQHESLLGHLRKNPDESFGRGYIAPKAAGTHDVVMEEYAIENAS